MAWLESITLEGNYATLVPLSYEHHDELTEAVKDGELWKLWYTLIPEPEKLWAEIQRRLELKTAGTMVPFTIIENATGRAVGMTNYMNIDSANRHLEIGGTWYQQRVQRTALNTECKLMMLTHAFEVLNCIAVEFRTHFFNRRSRHAIERLGAKLDGILRNHQIAPNDSLRDTCVYSIIVSEWLTVKSNLEWEFNRRKEHIEESVLDTE